MLFQLFPQIVYETSGSNVTDLPVEISAMILRCLDSQSLMNATNVNKKWMRVCVGDPTLRKRLATEVKERKERRFQILLNPGMTVKVLRKQKAQLYGVNIAKVVTKRKYLSEPEEQFGSLPTKKVKIFNDGAQVKRKQSNKSVLRRLRL